MNLMRKDSVLFFKQLSISFKRNVSNHAFQSRYRPYNPFFLFFCPIWLRCWKMKSFFHVSFSCTGREIVFIAYVGIWNKSFSVPAWLTRAFVPPEEKPTAWCFHHTAYQQTQYSVDLKGVKWCIFSGAPAELQCTKGLFATLFFSN